MSKYFITNAYTKKVGKLHKVVPREWDQPTIASCGIKYSKFDDKKTDDLGSGNRCKRCFPGRKNKMITVENRTFYSFKTDIQITQEQLDGDDADFARYIKGFLKRYIESDHFFANICVWHMDQKKERLKTERL